MHVGVIEKGVSKMLSILALVLAVLAIALWWHQVAKQKKHQSWLVSGQEPRRSYHCVEVHAGMFECEAARRLGNHRFLNDEAPKLPLPGCTAPTCTCSYIRHDDRRSKRSRSPDVKREGFQYATVGERRSRRAQHRAVSG